MNSVTALLPSWLKRDAHHSPSRPGAALLAEMREWVAQEKLIGGVGMIVRDGRTVFLEAVGLQDRERAIRAQPDTIFALTSATKPITCAGAMTLVDNDLLSLDDPIHRFIPAFRQQRLWDGSAPSGPILIRHIMTHCSGLIDAIPESFLATDYSLKELVAMGSVQPLAFHPGSRWAYANLGVNVLGRIIEIVSDRPFDEFIHRSILEPLGMRSSFYTLPRSREHRIAAAYASAAGVFVREELPFSSGHPFVAPSSSLFSTAQDLARFLQMLLGKGSFAGRRILSPHSAEAMVTSQTGSWKSGFVPGFGYGLGCSVITNPVGIFKSYSAGTFGHGGFFQTHAWADPRANLISIMLCQHRCIQPVSDEVASFISRSPGLL